jgi:predicted regulator of Ras-like GTPase activity (Roadblock/LC7/MglB family)
MKPAGERHPTEDTSTTVKGSKLHPENDDRGARIPHLLDDKRLEAIRRQPGVLAVLAFYEGFVVKSVGGGDFDQAAAAAEDFLRSGEKIVSDMRMGRLLQITLEAGDKKCIVVPCGDLYLCLLTRANVNLGLIRLMIRNLQGMEGAGTNAVLL